jgi:hypothetical protein
MVQRSHRHSGQVGKLLRAKHRPSSISSSGVTLRQSQELFSAGA